MYQFEYSGPCHIASISDLHVRSAQDDRYQLLLGFLRSEVTKKSDIVVLLGDIFDLMVGLHMEYFEMYHDFFKELENLVLSFKKVVFVAGNHDFHLEKLFHYFNKKFHQKYDLEGKPLGVFYCSFGFTVKSKTGKKILFSHGHEFVPRKWKSLSYLGMINGALANLLANHFVSLNFLNKIGALLAKKSDRHYTFFNEEQTKKNFRMWILPYVEEGHDLVICGHSHIQDSWIDNEIPKYANNGFCPTTKASLKIILGENVEVEFIGLSS